MQQGETRIHIDAAPEEVYAMVADVTRMGEWSPECYRCQWIEGATGPAVGARFRGYSKSRFLRWSRTVVVTAADPGREFAFTTLTDFINADSTNWRYRFEPENGGTAVTESYEVTKTPRLIIRVISAIAGRPHEMVPHMNQTLARLKAVAEGMAKE
jgi:uncharacterized protein YndB with AHSA1/START domain